jgi:hypothetical protein
LPRNEPGDQVKADRASENRSLEPVRPLTTWRMPPIGDATDFRMNNDRHSSFASE